MKPDSERKPPGEKVSASLTLVGFGMRPETVTESLGVQPSFTNVSQVTRCGTGRKEECGLWQCDTAGSIASRDVSEHIEHLLHLFRPLKCRIEEIRPRPNIFVHLRCEPASIMRPLAAPRIDARHVASIADFGAALTVELLPVKN
jgi:hypothetical protein